MFGFDASTVVVEVGEHRIVPRIKQLSRFGGQSRKNVPRLRSILSSHEPCTELAARLEKIDVVGARVVIG